MINWIPRHIENTKPGDEGLLTEIQGMESLWRLLFEERVTPYLKLEVVDWLQVGSGSC